MVNVAHYLFGHAESEVSFHLTRAESQAATMVGVHQGFDIGLFESGKINVVVDIINRKAYCHMP